MAEYISRDIHPCECGKLVAWLPSTTGGRLPYDIKREISATPDGKRRVVVCSEDFHYCQRYPALAKFIQDAIGRSRRPQVEFRLPGRKKRRFVLSYREGEPRARVTNGRSGREQQVYGSLNVSNGGYRVRNRSDVMQDLFDLLDLIDQNPISFDWSSGQTETHCCFCNRALNDPRSVEWGYGPTCADNYGLPWG